MERHKSLLHTDFLPSRIYSDLYYLVSRIKTQLIPIGATFLLNDILQIGGYEQTHRGPDGSLND